MNGMNHSFPKILNRSQPRFPGTGGNWDDMTHGAGDASWDAPAGAAGAPGHPETPRKG